MKDDKWEKLNSLERLGLLSFAIPLVLFTWALPVILLRAWVLTVLWGWFVVPVFGVDTLRYAHAMGVLCIVSTFGPHSRIKSEYQDSLGIQIAQSIVQPLYGLLIGWLIKVIAL